MHELELTRTFTEYKQIKRKIKKYDWVVIVWVIFLIISHFLFGISWNLDNKLNCIPWFINICVALYSIKLTWQILMSCVRQEVHFRHILLRNGFDPSDFE